MIDRKSVKIEPHMVLVDTEDNYYWTYEAETEATYRTASRKYLRIYKIDLFEKSYWNIDQTKEALTLMNDFYMRPSVEIKEIITEPSNYMNFIQWRETFYKKVFERETLKAIQSLKEKGML